MLLITAELSQELTSVAVGAWVNAIVTATGGGRADIVEVSTLPFELRDPERSADLSQRYVVTHEIPVPEGGGSTTMTVDFETETERNLYLAAVAVARERQGIVDYRAIVQDCDVPLHEFEGPDGEDPMCTRCGRTKNNRNVHMLPIEET